MTCLTVTRANVGLGGASISSIAALVRKSIDFHELSTIAEIEEFLPGDTTTPRIPVLVSRITTDQPLLVPPISLASSLPSLSDSEDCRISQRDLHRKSN